MMKRVTSILLLQDVCNLFRKTGDTLVKGIPVPVYESENVQCQFIKERGFENSNGAKTVSLSRSYFLMPVTVVPITGADYITFRGIKYNITDIGNYSSLDTVIELYVDVSK